MTPHTRHIISHARKLIVTVAEATRGMDNEPELSAWTAYQTDGAVKLAAIATTCDIQAAMLLIWLLAREKYESPEEFIQETGTLLGPIVLGDFV